MTILATWVHDLSPYLILFPEGLEKIVHLPGIRWYGLSYLAGFISAYFLLRCYHAKGRSPYEGEQILNLMTFLILGVLVGGRLGFFLFYRFDSLLSDPFVVFRVWEGGMASHGGFVGVCIAALLYARHSKQSPLPVGDLIVSVVSPGLFFGRIANFINGELWGRTTDVSWGVLFPKAPGFLQEIARHPSQLYAATLEGLCTFVFVQWRFWNTAIIIKNEQKYWCTGCNS